MCFTWIDAILKIEDGRHDFFFRGYPLNIIQYTYRDVLTTKFHDCITIFIIFVVSCSSMGGDGLLGNSSLKRMAIPSNEDEYDNVRAKHQVMTNSHLEKKYCILSYWF